MEYEPTSSEVHDPGPFFHGTKAELAVGDGQGRIYQVEPTGPMENDPNLTDKRFPGNPTRSYRTRQALRVVGEILDWEPHPPDVLQHMRDHLEELERQGVEAIDD